MDEKGLRMGKSARVTVICVCERRSPPLMKDGDRDCSGRPSNVNLYGSRAVCTYNAIGKGMG